MLAALAVLAACGAAPAAPSAVSKTELRLAGFWAPSSAEVHLVELAVDGANVYSAGVPAHGAVPIASLDLAPGNHEIAVRLVASRADTGVPGYVAVSTRGVFRVKDTGGLIRVELVMRPGAEPVATRLESRFHAETIELVSSTLPVMTPVSLEAVLLPGEQVDDSSDLESAELMKARALAFKVIQQRDMILFNRRAGDAPDNSVEGRCVDRQIAELDAAVASAGSRLAWLAKATRRRDAGLAGHELAILELVEERSRQFVAEVGGCPGNGAGE